MLSETMTQWEWLIWSINWFDIDQLILANPGPVVTEKLHASKFADEIGEDNIFLSVGDAVAICSPKLAEQQA